MMYVAGPSGVSFLVGLGLTWLMGKMRWPLWLGLVGVIASAVAVPLIRDLPFWTTSAFCLVGGGIGFWLGWHLAPRD